MAEMERTIAYIQLNAVEENLRNIRKFLKPGTKTLCVVKADAYGHGAVQVSKRLEELSVDYLGVATIKEGCDLRKNGIRLPVLVMSGLMPWDNLDHVLENDLSLVVYDLNTLTRIAEKGSSAGKSVNVHVKIDSGMGRLGFRPDELPDLAGLIRSDRSIVCEGLMSHFASSELRDEYGLMQVSRFQDAKKTLENSGVSPVVTHMANSGAVVQYPEAHFDMVRTGINLYGSYSDENLTKKIELRQVMKLASRIALIREFPAGSALGYGRTFVTQKNTRIAYVPVGYADGYPRSLSNKGFVLINGYKCFIVGTICMDWFLADISDLHQVDIGDEVILIGQGGRHTITADDIARQTGTIPYEVLCNISKRVPRVYV
ncbi:MAG TPA: alanine racemase [Syntrophorhabdaceae bacterium]|nr:alanine racemase [Syntrophorhabdaceae bacterium]